MYSVRLFQKESIEAGVIPSCKCRRVCGYKQQGEKGPNQYGWYFCCASADVHYRDCWFFQWIPNNKMILEGNLVDKDTGKI
jgi:hypothetical protein